jgi:hypothetical protein
MTTEMDFPANPSVGQNYTSPVGVTYTWNGLGWQVDYYTLDDQLYDLADLLKQIRVLLQDTDLTGTGYRYSDDELITNINMGMWEMYRARPDIFLGVNFVVPQFTTALLSTVWPLDQQYVPSIIYYAVGLAQMRDDEGTQDARASGFITKFTSTLLSLS